MDNKKNTETIKKETLYSKDQILNSKKYLYSKDIVNVVLKDEMYTLEEVDNLIDKFLKKGVN